MTEHTPGPWDYVPSTEHHGPYVTSDYGSDICDCYAMSNPVALSTRNGGESRPVHFMGEMADANARLIAAAPELLSALIALADGHEATIAGEGYDPGHCDCPVLDKARAAIAKALGQEPAAMLASAVEEGKA